MEVCYIRYPGKPWERGKTHHLRALDMYRSLKDESIISISVPHLQGGLFVAHFSTINDSVFHYRDEYNNEVDIMMCTPEKAAYINRIMDF